MFFLLIMFNLILWLTSGYFIYEGNIPYAIGFGVLALVFTFITIAYYVNKRKRRDKKKDDDSNSCCDGLDCWYCGGGIGDKGSGKDGDLDCFDCDCGGVDCGCNP